MPNEPQMTQPLPDAAFKPGTQLTLGSGQPFKVAEYIAEGGQGFVLGVARKSDVVLKQYRAEELSGSDLQRRITAMIAAPPPSWKEPRSGHVRLAWPLDAAFDGSRFVGFVMPRIDRSAFVPIHIVSNADDRAKPRKGRPDWVRGFSWAHLLQTAANLALATKALHDGGVVVGDFNEQNILVTGDARVTLVDCDSMQFRDRSGHTFLCEVGLEAFTAPEVAGRSDRPRELSSDLFPLAIHIHQLLLQGAYPFDGLWTGSGNPQRREENARSGLYVHGPDRRLKPIKSMVDFTLLPKSTQKLFLRAFVNGAKDPRARPTAEEWFDNLSDASRTLKTCLKNPLHGYPAHHVGCPWCRATTTSTSGTSTSRISAVRTPASRTSASTGSSAGMKAATASPAKPAQPVATRPAPPSPSPSPSPVAAPSGASTASPNTGSDWRRKTGLLAAAITAFVVLFGLLDHGTGSDTHIVRRALPSSTPVAQTSTTATTTSTQAAAAAATRAASKSSYVRSQIARLSRRLQADTLRQLRIHASVRVATITCAMRPMFWYCGPAGDRFPLYRYRVSSNGHFSRAVLPDNYLGAFSNRKARGIYWWHAGGRMIDLYVFYAPGRCAATASAEWKLTPQKGGQDGYGRFSSFASSAPQSFYPTRLTHGYHTCAYIETAVGSAPLTNTPPNRGERVLATLTLQTR